MCPLRRGRTVRRKMARGFGMRVRRPGCVTPGAGRKRSRRRPRSRRWTRARQGARRGAAGGCPSESHATISGATARRAQGAPRPRDAAEPARAIGTKVPSETAPRTRGTPSSGADSGQAHRSIRADVRESSHAPPSPPQRCTPARSLGEDPRTRAVTPPSAFYGAGEDLPALEARRRSRGACGEGSPCAGSPMDSAGQRSFAP